MNIPIFTGNNIELNYETDYLPAINSPHLCL